MMDSLLKRIEKNRKAHIRWLAMVLCLSMIVSLGTFAGFRQKAVAKTYTKEVLDCPYTHEGAEPVAHVHNDDCYDGETLVCTLPEREAHTHTDECFAEQRRLTCGLEENPGHQHGDTCYAAREVNVCGLEENPGHKHNGTCFNESGVLICTLAEGDGAHTHTADCFTTVYDLICEIPEGEGAHTHTEACYTTERVQVCDKQELPVHVHGAECIRTVEWTEGEEGPAAADEQTVNAVPEMPVSDPNADLETAEDWNREFEIFELSGNWARDLVLVAATQQGRGESPNNFEAVLNDAGDAWVRHGYTRYGAWYGVPYAEDWSAMFVSFCLRYAGIPEENVPNNPTAAFMAESFSNGELFAGRDYVPAVGDLIFFDTVDDEITNIDHMGIVYHVDTENGTINTVEGDRTEAVTTFGYYLNDEQIVGYGILPQNPEYNYTEEENLNDETAGLIVMTEEEKQEETTVTADVTAPAVPMPAQSWERTAGGIKVTVEAPEGAFPGNTKIAVTPVNGNSLKDTVSDAVNGEVLEVQAVDITFFDADGHEIEPAVPIRVVMTPAATQHAEEKTSVVHVDIAQQTAELVEQAVGTEFDNSEVVFDADAFTIYAIVYTYQVEYEYEVDGKTFTSSMPGAENMTLTQIVQGLGIVDEAEIDTFVSKIASIASSNEEVAIVTENNEIRVLKDGEAKIVITMQDGAKFHIDVRAEGETSASNETATVSTKGDLYLPADAELKAEVLDEVKSESAIAAVEAQEGTADSNAAAAETAYQVFDISLENVEADQYDGFQVEVRLPGGVAGKNFRLYHVHDGKVDELELDNVAPDGETVLLESVSFATPSFSEFVLSYTVDFEYEVDGKVYQYSMQGGTSMLLSELIEILHVNTSGVSIDQFMKQIADVTYSNPELLEIVKTENDWILNSLQSFETEESLVITMKDGSSFMIRVTDPATQNVSELLENVDINASKNPDGSYTVYADQPYSIELEFKEKPSGTQFDMTNGFYYPLPEGLFDADILTGKAMIELSGGDHAGESVELDYHLEGNNLVFTWPDQTSGAYEQLRDAIYTHFKIKINAKINEGTTELEFSDTITKHVDVKTDGKADVTKTGSYNPATNSIDYTVTVKSSGICKNVVVTDTISGTALTYNNDAAASSNLNTSLPAPSASGNGFKFTIPQMGDGETVTVKYSAAVNLDALTRNDDGTLGTVTQTGNKVTVTPSNHPGDEDETSGKDLNNKISYSTIRKTGTAGATGADGHATVTWTIRANQNANVSMAGHTISDEIGRNSRDIMKYSGMGITVVRKDANGNTVGEAVMIPWNNLTSHSDSAWTWTVPNSSPDTDKLSYEITYTTDVDVSESLFNEQVKNHAEDDFGDEANSHADVTPPGGPLVARKVYLGKNMTGDEKTVTWEVNFDVPATGLDSAVIDDTLPNYWPDNSPLTDQYKEGSITITSLAFGESYEVSSYTDDAGREHMTVTFYKTVDDQKETGLSGTGVKRKIRVQFQTVLNEEWLEASKINPNILTHTNNANVILNGQTLGTQASVKIDVSEPEMIKSHATETVNVVNNNQLPAWQFFITLSGVSDDTFDENGQIVFYDTYNSRYLDWYPHAYPDWEKQNGQVFGGNSDNKFTESSTGKVMTKVSDGQLKIVLNQSDLPMDDNGEYYPLYTIPYYLTVKDPIALKKMIANASYTPGGSIPLYNTVTNPVFGEAEDHVDYEVPVVEKKATEPELTNGVYKLHYTIDINKRALQLGDSDELVMKDEYSNISIDYTTLKIYEVVTDQYGNIISKTEANDVIWDRSGYISTYYLNNATHYMIEYDAHLSGEGEKINDTQSSLTYTNTAEVFGKKSTWEKTKTIDTSGSGGSRTFRVKVLKHVKGNASQGLPGAVFQLWWYPSTADDPNGKNNRPDKNDLGWENTGKTLTTDANGYAQTLNEMSIHSQTWYKLVEVTAPTGYTLKTTHYFFWITEGQTADYSKYVYLDDDVLAINNTPELPETVNVSVRKVWNDNSDLTLRRDITVHLYVDGQPYNSYYSGEYAANARTDADVVLHLNADGTSDTYTWTGLPSGPAYSVVEDPVPGYTTVYSPKNTLTGGELTITNKRNPEKTAISVDKAWGSGTVPSEDVTIQLKRRVSPNASIVIQNGADNAGATGAHITDYSVPAGATVKLIWTWKQGWGLNTPALNIYNFGTKEPIYHINEMSGDAEEHSVEVAVPADGIIVAFEKPYLNNLSAFQEAFDFEFEVVATGSGTSAEDVNFNNEHHYLTLSPSNNWHLDIDGLLISDSDGAYTYYIEEIGVNDNTQTPADAGYVVTYSDNNATGILNGTITVTNEKEPPAKIQVTKTFSGIDALPEGFRITNNYNDVVFTIANAAGEGTAASPYTWVIDEIPAGTEVVFTETGATVDGYALTITTNGTAHPEGSTTASASGTAAKVAAGDPIPTVAFVNGYEKQEPQTGTLKITKSVKIGDQTPESVAEDKKSLANGTYTFEIWKITDPTTEPPTMEKVTTKADGTTTIGDLKITITNGVADPEKITVDGLEAGTYVVKETASTNSAMMVDTSVNGYESNLGGIKVVVSPGNAENVPTAAFINKYETTEATVKKIWSGDGADTSKRPDSIKVTLVADGEETDKYVTLLKSDGWAEKTISKLPKYNTTTTGEIIYTWHEEKISGYLLTDVSEDENHCTTLTNTLAEYDLTTSYIGTKIWDDQDNTFNTRPDNLQITLKHSLLDPTTGQYLPFTDTNYTLEWKSKETNSWIYEFKDIPVYDSNGNPIHYKAEETTVPGGYILSPEPVVTDTIYSHGSIFEIERITPNSTVEKQLTLSSEIDLAYCVIKLTQNSGYLIWTHRIPTDWEKNEILDLYSSEIGKKTVIWASGSGDIPAGKGKITFTFDENSPKIMKLNLHATNEWAYVYYGNFKDSEYSSGTTQITNKLETTGLEGQKIWSISGTEIPENPILTLTRTVTTIEGEGAETNTPAPTEPAEVEENETGKEVKTEQIVDPQPTPVWSGDGKTRTFTYSGLPKYDKDGNPYTYSVSEASFTIKINGATVTYTVTKDEKGDYVATTDSENAPKFKVTQEGNIITNTELTDFEFSKIWQDAAYQETEWPSGKTIKVKVERKIGSEGTPENVGSYEIAKSDTDFGIASSDGAPALTVVKSDDTSKTYTFKLSDLPKFGTIGSQPGEYMYFVTETEAVPGYKNASYRIDSQASGETISMPYAQNGGKIINTPEEGYELPQTGGIGTTLFTALGGLMTATAGAILTMKSYRRRKENA